jgi:hypothetical protein
MNEKKLILIGNNFINVDAIARAGINRDFPTFRSRWSKEPRSISTGNQPRR